MRLLAIDPGVDTGWSLWDGGTLVECALSSEFPIDVADRAIIERPQVYDRRHSKGDPNDLITLAIRVGRYTERLDVAGVAVSHVLPRDWKGTVDPDVFCARVIRDLSPANAATVIRCTANVSTRKLHNVIDAVGLGAWALRQRPPRT